MNAKAKATYSPDKRTPSNLRSGKISFASNINVVKNQKESGKQLTDKIKSNQATTSKILSNMYKAEKYQYRK